MVNRVPVMFEILNINRDSAHHHFPTQNPILLQKRGVHAFQSNSSLME